MDNKADKFASKDRDDVLVTQVPGSGDASMEQSAGHEEYNAGQEGLARGTPDELPPPYDASASKWGPDAVEGTDRKT